MIIRLAHTSRPSLKEMECRCSQDGAHSCKILWWVGQPVDSTLHIYSILGVDIGNGLFQSALYLLMCNYWLNLRCYVFCQLVFITLDSVYATTKLEFWCSRFQYLIQNCYQRFMIRFYLYVFSNDINWKLITTPTYGQCLLLELSVSSLCRFKDPD